MITQFHQMVIARKKVSYNPSLVNVRRSSDSAEQVYLLSELTDGAYLGAELVTNGGFYTDTGWTKLSGTTISSGTLNASTGTAFAPIAEQLLSPNGNYLTEYEIASYTSGDERFVVGGTAGAIHSGVGVFRSVVNATSGTKIYFEARASGFTGSIDNVSVREWSQSTVEGVVGAGNEGYVDTWLDQGSLGNNASQATTSNQPLLVENGALVLDSAGNAAMSVDASDHFDGDAGLSFGTGDVTFCLGLDFADWLLPSDSFLFETHDLGNNRVMLYINSSGVVGVQFINSGGSSIYELISPTVPISTGYHHITLTLDRDDVLTLYVDGVANGSTDMTSSSSVDVGDSNVNVFTFCKDSSTVGKASHFSVYYSLLDASAVSDHYDAVTAGTVYGSPEVWLSLPPASALP